MKKRTVSPPQQAPRTYLLKKRTVSLPQKAPRTYLLKKRTVSPPQQAPRIVFTMAKATEQELSLHRWIDK